MILQLGGMIFIVKKVDTRIVNIGKALLRSGKFVDYSSLLIETFDDRKRFPNYESEKFKIAFYSQLLHSLKYFNQLNFSNNFWEIPSAIEKYIKEIKVFEGDIWMGRIRTIIRDKNNNRFATT